MELLLVLRVLRRWWWLALIPVVITGALALPALLNRAPAASGGFTTTFRYSAAQQLEAIPNRDGDYQDVWLASELTVNALTDWVRTSSFAASVADTAAGRGAEIDPALLGVAADNERSVGQLFLSYPDAAALETIAAAAIEVLQTRNSEVFPQLGGEPAAVTILDTPQVAPAPPSLANRFEPLIRVALGALAGVALAFLAHYLDPILRRREDVEALGLPIIASIPKT
jgi:hypothetical protein